MKHLVLIGALALITLAACSLPSGVQQMGEGAATAAVELRETAEAFAPTAEALRQTAQAYAPTLEAQAPGIRQTLEALAPTLQAQAPEIAKTLEALATEQPLDGVGVRQTLDALTGGIGSTTPTDIPIAENPRVLISSADHFTYTTPQGFGAVLELYQAGMPEQGWNELPDAIISEAAAQLRYQKGARTATVVIARMAEGTTVDITLVEDR